ncbi:hypothetical protein NDU88_005356 [Pleurodeles waltl]|uniref:Uncharacterized protein n=1 Tax=Pleurodeles waltl TaxID=8319 RepID=A0AAV7LMM3_PLEWA|nr:hypothetical protein NDU88_005356 [Pleurodeles waltl]
MASEIDIDTLGASRDDDQLGPDEPIWLEEATDLVTAGMATVKRRTEGKTSWAEKRLIPNIGRSPGSGSNDCCIDVLGSIGPELAPLLEEVGLKPTMWAKDDTSLSDGKMGKQGPCITLPCTSENELAPTEIEKITEEPSVLSASVS